MKEFIVNLYANEYFPIYLGGILLVLIIAFFVVLILGKKDKKNIEKTQKLEQINAAAFNEANVSVNSEVTLEPVMQQEYTDDKTHVYPAITPEVNPPREDIPNVETTQVVPETAPVVQVEQNPAVLEPVIMVEQVPVEPVIAPISPDIATPVAPAFIEPTFTSTVENVIPVPVVDNTEIPVVQAPIENKNTALLEEDEQPLLQNFDNLAASISSELDSLQQAQDKYNSLTNQVPVEDTLFDETAQIEMPSLQVEVQQTPVEATPINNVFSSVYVPQKNDASFDDEEEIELPRLK